jgi:hypothetical protein
MFSSLWLQQFHYDMLRCVVSLCIYHLGSLSSLNLRFVLSLLWEIISDYLFKYLFTYSFCLLLQGLWSCVRPFDTVPHSLS